MLNRYISSISYGAKPILEKYIEIQAKIELTNSHGCVIITHAVVATIVSQAKAPLEVIIPARYSNVLPEILFIADCHSCSGPVQKRDRNGHLYDTFNNYSCRLDSTAGCRPF